MAALRFAVIGTGRFGQHYVRILQSLPGAVLKTVVSRSSGDPDAVLRDREIDCVVIATPAATHFDYLRRGIEAGKHVLVEKPMVLSVAQAEVIKNLLDKSPVVMMVGHQYVYNAHLQLLKNEITSGRLGRVRFISYEHFYPGPVREDVGAFWDAAPHALSIIDWLCDGPEVATAQGSILKITQEKFDDFAQTMVEFEGRVQLAFAVSSVAPQKTRRMTFAAENGVATFTEIEGQTQLQMAVKGSVVALPTVLDTEPLRSELEHFIRSVQTGETPITGIAHGLRVTRNLEKIYRRLG
jgi:predicted dehydrogenase